MSNNRELSEFADYLVVDDTTKNVGIGTTLKISAGGIFVGNTEIVRPDGTWGGPNSGLVGAQGAQGVQGAVGAQGAQGAQGVQGASGSATITNNADNRVITGGTGTNLNGEANLTFDGTNLGINQSSPSSLLDIYGSNPAIELETTGTYASRTFLQNNDGTLRIRQDPDNSGSSSAITFEIDASEKFRILSDGSFGIGGANYGTSGQVLTSQGSGSAPQWATPVEGKILKVAHTIPTTTASDSVGANSWSTNMLQISFTATSSSSHILLRAVLYGSTSGVGEYIGLGFVRDGTVISDAIGGAAGTRPRVFASAYYGYDGSKRGPSGQYIEYLVPTVGSTSSITWGVAMFNLTGGTKTLYRNRTPDDTDGEHSRNVSSFTIMEVAS